LIKQYNENQNRKYPTVVTVAKYCRHSSNIETINTFVHDPSLSCLGTGIYIKSDGVIVVL
jgi:hypothetical protein